MSENIADRGDKGSDRVGRDDGSDVNDGVERAAERLRTLYAAIGCGVIVLDMTREVVDANAAAQQIVGLGLEEMRGHRLRDFMPRLTREDGSDLPEEERYSLRVLRTGQPQRDVVVGMTRPDGQRRWLRMDYAPVFVDDGIGRIVVSLST